MKTLKAKERDFETPAWFQHSELQKKLKVIYPENDGNPMSENTRQFEWIVKIKENLERMFADRSDVFVAGDLLWYPVEGNNIIRTAPDIMVAFGRPKGHRGSYRTWDEGGISPQVVFEILSPGNRKSEMDEKREFYETYGVKEYYIWDPDRIRLDGWIRSGRKLCPLENMQGWVSPLLGIRFELKEGDLHIFDPDGKEFQMLYEVAKRADAERQRADAERQRADAERQRADAERQKADAERQRADAAVKRAEELAAKLRELGINPE